LNAWNDGPYVNAYAINHVNNDFYAFKNPSSGYENIEYTGPGPHQTQCVSDYGNTSGDARAGLSGQCQNSNVSWGANFQLKACDNGDAGDAFWNVHWQGWLTPNSHSNGSPFYLNSKTKTCYKVSGAGEYIGFVNATCFHAAFPFAVQLSTALNGAAVLGGLNRWDGDGFV
jgi:hypothetical protein